MAQERSEYGSVSAPETSESWVVENLIMYRLRLNLGGKSTLTANITANIIRNVWTNVVIFCGHFPDRAEKSTKKDLDNETQGQWYLRAAPRNMSRRVRQFLTRI